MLFECIEYKLKHSIILPVIFQYESKLLIALIYISVCKRIQFISY